MSLGKIPFCSGFSLVEMLISLIVGFVILIGIVQMTKVLFVSQEEARSLISFDQLQRDIKIAIEKGDMSFADAQGQVLTFDPAVSQTLSIAKMMQNNIPVASVDQKMAGGMELKTLAIEHVKTDTFSKIPRHFVKLNLVVQDRNGKNIVPDIPILFFVKTACTFEDKQKSSLSTGSTYTCVVVNNVTKCWGDNSFGQLGNGNTTQQNVPVTIQNVSGIPIAAGSFHTCEYGKCWGANTYGQLGDNTLTSRNYASNPISALGGALKTISVGQAHTCAIVEIKGYAGAKCWGRNDDGRVGDNTTKNRKQPVNVTNTLGGGWLSPVTAISAGGEAHTCAIQNGAVYCWGGNGFGQIGSNIFPGSLKPILVGGNLNNAMTDISAGSWHNCAIRNSGVLCWGRNNYGQLGIGFQSNTPQYYVSNLTTGVTAISAGLTHTCAIQNGAAKCWGNNSNGQLGNGNTTQQNVPVDVSGLSSGVTAISAGGAHTCAIHNCVLKCWGNNSKGQLGNGTTTSPYLTPVKVNNIP